MGHTGARDAGHFLVTRRPLASGLAFSSIGMEEGPMLIAYHWFSIGALSIGALCYELYALSGLLHR